MQSETIATAWRRAELTGLHPRSPRDATVSPVDPTSRLLRAAQPVLDRMESILEGTNVCIILADRDVRLVDLRPGSANIRDALAENGGLLGNLFSEETSGTNSVATVHELRTPLAVHGDEHFLEPMKRFSCYGYPIIHPLTHRLEGVLDLTVFRGEDNSLLYPMLRQAARDAEAQLLEQSPRDEQTLINTYQRASARRRSAPLVGIAGDLVLANSRATALLQSVDIAVLRTFIGASASGGHTVADHTLSSGVQVTLRITRTTPGTGIVIEVDPMGSTTSAAPPGKVRARSRIERVKNRIVEARVERTPMAVIGERGTGRTTVLAQLMADAQPVIFDAVELAGELESTWLQRVTDALDRAEHPVIIENVHLLSPLAARATRAAIERTSAWFALSSDPLHLLPPEVSALVDSAAARLELLPLRLRKNEVPALVETMLTELSSPARFTPAAFRTLLAHNWPGNLSELRAEVTAATERRSAGDISDADLVRLNDRAAAPQLNAVDTVLRAALEDALTRHGGNKLAAARSLDISRTTLYKRMQAFGLAG